MMPHSPKVVSVLPTVLPEATQGLVASPRIARLISKPSHERRLGPFLLVRQLGLGGFAPVWLAREMYGTQSLRDVAVKLFSMGTERALTLPDAQGSIIAEASALCRVEHENVVRFYALPHDEQLGVMGLAMEYVAGPSVERLVSAARLPLRDTLALGVALASALSAVHRAGLIHRDVKPGNIIASGGRYKLIDFGLAAAEAAPTRHARHSGVLDLTQQDPLHFASLRFSAFHTVLSAPSTGGGARTISLQVHCGTLGYADPARLSQGAGLTTASDLYGLGATLFRCIAGVVPAAFSDDGRLLPAILNGREPAPAMAKVAPHIPQALARLIDSLLAQEPSQRPRAAEDVKRALEDIALELDASPRTSHVSEPPRPASQRPSTPPPNSETRISQRPSWQPAGPFSVPPAPSLPDASHFSLTTPQTYDGVGVCAVHNVMIIVRESPSRLHRTRWLFGCAERLIAQLGGEDIVFLYFVYPSSDPPDNPSRLEFSRRFKKQKAIKRVVMFTEGDETWTNLVGTVTRSFGIASGELDRFMFQETFEEACEKAIFPHGDKRLEVHQLATAFLAVTTALGVRPPNLL